MDRFSLRHLTRDRGSPGLPRHAPGLGLLCPFCLCPGKARDQAAVGRVPGVGGLGLVGTPGGADEQGRAGPWTPQLSNWLGGRKLGRLRQEGDPGWDSHEVVLGEGALWPVSCPGPLILHKLGWEVGAGGPGQPVGKLGQGS